MKKSNHSDSQILSILNQSKTGTPVSDLYCENIMSSVTFLKAANQIRCDGCFTDGEVATLK